MAETKTSDLNQDVRCNPISPPPYNPEFSRSRSSPAALLCNPPPAINPEYHEDSIRSAMSSPARMQEEPLTLQENLVGSDPELRHVTIESSEDAPPLVAAFPVDDDLPKAEANSPIQFVEVPVDSSHSVVSNEPSLATGWQFFPTFARVAIWKTKRLTRAAMKKTRKVSSHPKIRKPTERSATFVRSRAKKSAAFIKDRQLGEKANFVARKTGTGLKRASRKTIKGIRKLESEHQVMTKSRKTVSRSATFVKESTRKSATFVRDQSKKTAEFAKEHQLGEKARCMACKAGTGVKRASRSVFKGIRNLETKQQLISKSQRGFTHGVTSMRPGWNGKQPASE